MPAERIIPSSAPKTAVTFTIFSDGSEVSREFHVLSITVTTEVNRIPSATILLLDGEAARQTFVASSAPDFEPGREIEIKIGYRSEEDSVFKGIVVKHSIKVRGGNSILAVECRDAAVKMTGASRSRYFRDLKDSEIIEQLISEHGLQSDVSASSYMHKQTVQYNCTDWDFMLCRCDASGMFCFVKDGSVKVSAPDLNTEAVLTIQYGATVLDLDAEIDARLQYKKFDAASWNYSDGEVLNEVEGSDPGVPQVGNLDRDKLASVLDEEAYSVMHSGKLEEPELQSWSDSKTLRSRLAQVRGRVKTEGTAAVQPGQFIQLNGVGERFEGKLFVSAIRHEMQNGSWTTAFQFGISPDWFAETFNVRQPPAGALLPPVTGLQVGVVTQAHGDPDGENRIMVRLPMVQDQDEGAWCRLATLDAGNERGFFFLPEVGDEVIVGFINDDPRHGVVLGMMHSSNRPAPLEATEDNHEKGLQTRSKMKMIFDDDKKSLLIETPGGNSIHISDDEKLIELKDMNGNKIVMDSSGISIESSKEIKLKAQTNIKVEGSANVEVKAGAQAKMEGSAGAEFSSSGVTNVKGSLVNIN